MYANSRIVGVYSNVGSSMDESLNYLHYRPEGWTFPQIKKINEPYTALS